MTNSKRIYAIDVLRGATIALMILVNNPGSWQHIFSPLKHARWHGVTLTDVVFPFFLFVVGMSIGIVSDRIKGWSTQQYFTKVIKRTFLIFCIGLLLNYSPGVYWDADTLSIKPLDTLRIMGVLQRIALCYFFTCLIVRYAKKISTVLFITLFLWVLYWLMCYTLGLSGEHPYSIKGYFGLLWDQVVFGNTHLYQGEGIPFDPEGLASTMPALGNSLMGYLGYRLFNKYKKNRRQLLSIGLVSVGLLVLAQCWDAIFPFNKKIWTSSYSLYTSALAMLVFLIFYGVFDLWKTKYYGIIRGIGYANKVLGMNALFIYILNGLLVNMISIFSFQINGNTYSPWHWFYVQMTSACHNEKLASLICALTMLLLMWLAAWLLYKKRIFIKV